MTGTIMTVVQPALPKSSRAEEQEALAESQAASWAVFPVRNVEEELHSNEC